MNDTILFEKIKDTIEDIEKDLYSHGTGIYFAPELYTAFRIGQAVMKYKNEIFGSDNVKWLREINLGNGGPSDIAFKVAENYTVVIELKLRDTFQSYKDDIEKLKKLQGKYIKFFCVLLDSYNKCNDERLFKLENEYSDIMRSVGHHHFETWNNWYQKQIHCNLNLYSITT